MKNFKSIMAILFLVVSLSVPTLSHADDSGPGTWDFLLFGNYDLKGNFNSGYLGQSANGTNLYEGNTPVTGNGYGLGFGTEYWFTNNIAARLLLQANAFTNTLSSNLKNGPFFGFGAVTLGPVIKLYGSTDYFVYAPVDLGYAITANSTGNPSVIDSASSLTVQQGHSFYADAGLGLNIRLLTIEAKIAWLSTPGTFGGNSLFFPITIGFDL